MYVYLYVCVIINECRIFCINVVHFIHTTVYTLHRERGSLFLFLSTTLEKKVQDLLGVSSCISDY